MAASTIKASDTRVLITTSWCCVIAASQEEMGLDVAGSRWSSRWAHRVVSCSALEPSQEAATAPYG